METQIVKGVIAVVLGIALSALGGFDSLLKLYIGLMLADLAFGCYKGIKLKNFASAIARWGFLNKIVTLIVVALCVLLDEVIDQQGLIRNISIIWFSLCEGASIFENLVAVGIPCPDGVREILIQAKKGFSINFSQIVGQLIKNYIPQVKAEDALPQIEEDKPNE